MNISRCLKLIWVSPNTLIGLLIGGVGLLFGSKYQVRRGCIEFHSGLVAWLLRRGPLGSGILGMTIGHTILGQTSAGLDVSRDHEHVHVAQYERWGPFFLPAYFGCSAYMWLKGKDPYRDNPFEVEAYAIDDLQSDKD